MSESEELKCRHCGVMFPKDHLLDGLCMNCYSEQEEDTKQESELPSLSTPEFESFIENIALGDNVLVYKWMLIQVFKESNDTVKGGIIKVIKGSFV